MSDVSDDSDIETMLNEAKIQRKRDAASREISYSDDDDDDDDDNGLLYSSSIKK